MNACLRRLGLLLLVAASGSVQAQDAAPAADAPLVASDAWIRTPPPGSPVMAGYVTLRNDGVREVRFAKLRSDAFGAIEIHEMRDSGGMMRMRPVPELVIQPGDTETLAPGGLHLMLFRPTREIADGATVTIDLLIEDGAPMPVEFVLRADAP